MINVFIWVDVGIVLMVKNWIGSNYGIISSFSIKMLIGGVMIVGSGIVFFVVGEELKIYNYSCLFLVKD